MYHCSTSQDKRRASSIYWLASCLGNACWATVMIIPSIISTSCIKSHTGNSSIPVHWQFLRPVHTKQFRKWCKKQLWNILSLALLNPNRDPKREFLLLPLALVFFSVHVRFVSFTLFSQVIQMSTLFGNSSDLLGIIIWAREELHQLIMPCMQKSALDVFVFWFTDTVLVLFYVKE